jgi:antirestriction protein ArdC
MTSSELKLDLYARVTNKILADLEKGELTWLKPWQGGTMGSRIARPLRSTGEAYQGINVLLLWTAALEQGFSASTWMTFKQAHDLGAHIKKGEKGSLVVYANTLTKTETNAETGEEETHSIPFMKGYTVFNVEQIDGLPDRFTTLPAQSPVNSNERDAALDAFFHNTGVTIREGGDLAAYSEALDLIRMPPMQAFKDRENFYATLGHEAVHSTKHPTRLNRDCGGIKFGDEGYAKEELVAELGAAFLCADLDITPETREDHAAYIGSWLTALKNDKRFIFSAAAHAQRAVDYLNACQVKAQPHLDSEEQAA